ncbi:hypothetical protein [Micromonospora sp. NPDC049240]|uniref:hypothetical protein n=1 Tax=Micromonospora sp. NPDC049240 TaxID=3155151 RepID=UPI0033DB622E
MSRVTRNMIRSLFAAGCAAGLVAVAAPPASAATFTGYLQGTCAQASGSAYRLQMKIPVNELNVPVVYANGSTGTVSATTAFMTMNVEWCSNGSAVTYAKIVSSNADRTSGGVTTNLERKSYTKSGTPPTAVGGPYTLGTAATWGRNFSGTVSGQPFGVGGSLTFTPANFTSTMTVKVYPTDARVECTGTAVGHPEFCSLNY